MKISNIKIVTSFFILLILAGCSTSNNIKQGEKEVFGETSSQDLILQAYEHDPQAQYELALRYEFGKGLPASVKEAVYWMRSAAKQGHIEAQFQLAGYYAIVAKKLFDADRFDESKKMFLSAKEWLEPLANNGYAKAQHEMARLYSDGLGVKKDWAIAEKWYRLAADQGDSFAEENLGRAYFTRGKSGKVDYKIAAKYLQRSARKGLVLSQYLLGSMYLEGQGVPQNNQKAFKWMKEAATNGLPIAQNDLGWMYGKGKGVILNDRLAVYWFQRAAAQGDKEAKKNLARRYMEGKGVPVNINKAKELDPDIAETYTGGFLRADPNNSLPTFYKEHTKSILEWE